MSFKFLFSLVLVSLATISKAGFGDFISNIGDNIKDAWDDVVENVKGDVKNEVDDAIDNIIIDAVLPDGAENLGKDLNTLLDQARSLRQEGANFTTQKIEIMDIFNEANLDDFCGHCTEFIDDIKNHETGEKVLIDILVTLCKNYFSSTYCGDAIKVLFTDMSESINEPHVNSTWTCQRLAMCPYLINNDTLNPFVDNVLQGKPAESNTTAASTNRSTYQVLHMTDIHIDFQYQEGTWARCPGFMCCQADSGASPNPNDGYETAGYWGGIGVCDIPARTYEQFLRFASKNFNVSFILWTGDNIDHEVWAQTQDTQLDPTRNATSYLQQFFPNTTIYPMFGNHEAFPIGQYDTFGNSDDWLKTELGSIWQSLFTQDSLNEFTKNSYYSTVNEKHNLKIISLDTQTCDTLNFQLIKETSPDPLNQLAWLRDELLDAENNNQTVFIMGHISPGDLNCDPQWSARYRAIVDRFTNIIKGQFFGHTHTDHFQVVRSYSEGNPPVGVIFMAPSLTTYTELVPSFRILEIDSETNELVDYKQYRLDLIKWNKNTTGPIEWDLAYSFLDEYGLKDISPASVDALVERIKTDNATATTYIHNFNTGVEIAFDVTSRSVDYYYCSAKYSQPHDIVNCLGLDPGKTNLLYFTGEFVPGVLDEAVNNNDNNG